MTLSSRNATSPAALSQFPRNLLVQNLSDRERNDYLSRPDEKRVNLRPVHRVE